MLNQNIMAKAFLYDLASLNGLTDPQTALLEELILRMTSLGTIPITALERKRIIEKTGITDKTYIKYMSAIVKSGLIIRHSNTDYEAPHYSSIFNKLLESLEQPHDFELTIQYKHRKGVRHISSYAIAVSD